MIHPFWAPVVMVALASAHPTAGEPPAKPRESTRVVLVELFTSQGCSSCPPADALVRELPRLGYGRDKVLPLTFHVDYWDQLGWKDRFALPEFTRRQAWYASLPALRSLPGGISGSYTPQMIIDGRVHFSGQRRTDALREIDSAAARAPAFALAGHATVRGATVEVSLDVTDLRETPGRGEWRLSVALSRPTARTVVTRGENAGETLEEAAVVSALSVPMSLPHSRQSGLTVRVSHPGDVPWSSLQIVAFVQSATTGEIGGAAMLDPEPPREVGAHPTL